MSDSQQIGVIFDLDGVLVDSADAHFESWRRLGKELGTKLTRQEFESTFGRRNSEIIPKFFGQLPVEKVKQLGDRKEEIYRDIIRQNPPIVDGAGALLDGLKALGARIAIGSSAPKQNIDLIVQAGGWESKFDAIINADDVSKGKPDPQVFSISCERLRLPPRRCVVLEDAGVGVQAAKAAGTRCIAIAMNGNRDALRDADLIVDRLADVLPKKIMSLASL